MNSKEVSSEELSQLRKDLGVRIHFLKTYYINMALNIYVFAYRGYSNSTGEPDEEQIKRDAEAIYDFVGDSEVILHGRQLGANVAAYLAAKKKVKGIILDNPFISTDSVLERQIKYFRYLVRLFPNTDKWDVREEIR